MRLAEDHCQSRGKKGWLQPDARARGIGQDGRPIPKLHAAGNNAGDPFGNRYRGAGGTIGPALTFAFVAINDIAARGSEPAGAQGLKPTGDA